MKYLLCIASYPDERQEHFLKYHSPRNKQYCDHHGFVYIEITDLDTIPEECKQRKLVWWRFFLIRYWIEKGELQEGDIISQIDADICIVNGEEPFEPFDTKSFAYAIDSCNTHCMGAFSIRVNDWSKKMLDNLLEEKRYLKYKDTPFWQMFHEQACWYSLAGIKAEFANKKQLGWNLFPDLGWHSTTENEPVYSVEELKSNVEILPVEWNVTDFSGHSPYFRFKTVTTNPKDVVFRHFAGCHTWDKRWALIPMFSK